MRMTLQWDKLSPAEFQQLQDLAAYSSRKLEDVLGEFCSATTFGGVPKYNPDGEIDYEGFRKFLDTYLEVTTPDDLSRHLFLSFLKKSPRNVDGKAFK
ncbi:diacylglycerol kinase 1-like, partial [Chelonus insularis]|uniref:diacylglycerol kinase 1-like n=1 Tax=Chelonus insularis TaxID=460826 RepID=UPI00158846E7